MCVLPTAVRAASTIVPYFRWAGSLRRQLPGMVVCARQQTRLAKEACDIGLFPQKIPISVEYIGLSPQKWSFALVSLALLLRIL